MWSLLFALFIYLRQHSAFEKIETRYHRSFQLQVVLWFFLLWTIVEYQVRLSPKNIELYELADSKATGGDEIVKGTLLQWLTCNMIIGTLVSLSTFIIGYRYGSALDVQCLKSIDAFIAVHGEARLLFYKAVYAAYKKRNRILDTCYDNYTRDEIRVDQELETTKMYEHIDSVVTTKLSPEVVHEILSELEEIVCYASAVITRERMWKLGIGDDGEHVPDDVPMPKWTRSQRKSAGGLKVNRMFHLSRPESKMGKYIVPLKDVISVWDSEFLEFKDIEEGYWADIDPKKERDYVVYKVRTRITREFDKNWEDPVKMLKPSDGENLSFLELEKWCLLYKWSLHPQVRGQMYLDWREDLARWELFSYFGNVIQPQHYVVERNERAELFPWSKHPDAMRPSMWNDARAGEVETGMGVLVLKSLLDNQIGAGYDNARYLSLNHLNFKGNEYVKAYVAYIDTTQPRPYYHLILELDVLKMALGESPPQTMSKEERNDLATKHFVLVHQDMEQFIRNAERDFLLPDADRGDADAKETTQKLIRSQCHHLLRLKPLSAGFKFIQYNRQQERFVVVSADPTLYTIPRSSRMFKFVLGVPILIDLLSGLYAMYGLGYALMYKADKVRAVWLMGLFGMFWAIVLMAFVGYQLSKQIARLFCGYIEHPGHGFGLEYERVVKSVRVDDIKSGPAERKNQSLFRRLSNVFGFGSDPVNYD
jgi:hypothetical protein